MRHRVDCKNLPRCRRHTGTLRQFDRARLNAAARIIATLHRVTRLIDRVVIGLPRPMLADAASQEATP
jgi:hypothetical protein